MRGYLCLNMRTEIPQQTINEIAPASKRDYGIAPLELKTVAPTWQLRPWWLYAPGTLAHSACPDETTAKEIYNQFFLFHNTQCQKAMFGSLMQELAHAEDNIFNIYDNSKASVTFAANAVESIVNRWKQKITALIGADNAVAYSLWLETFLVIHENSPVNTYDATTAMKALSQGTAPHDFLANHPETQNQFNRHLLGLSYHALNNKLQVAKVVTDSVQNKS